MYVAYSSASTPREGTTNLHVDISDAVNLLIYTADVKDRSENDAKKMTSLITSCGCPQSQVERFKRGEVPGALWHIFKPSDADEIRNFFLKVIFYYYEYAII